MAGAPETKEISAKLVLEVQDLETKVLAYRVCPVVCPCYVHRISDCNQTP